MQVWPYAHPWHFGLVKRSDIEIDKYIFIKLSELVVFDYGLSDTQDGRTCLSFMVNTPSLWQELRWAI